MGWQDRNYNAGRENMRAYMANPASMLSFALPIYKSPGLYVHLSFWFLLSALFIAIDVVRSGAPAFLILPVLMVMLGVTLFHEWGHRVLARRVGGNHWEWVLWPLGGMVAPSSPRRPGAVFVANIGGIVFTLGLAAAVAVAAILIPGFVLRAGPGLFSLLNVDTTLNLAPVWGLAISACARIFFTLSVLIVLMNLFPCFWFDGGYIWQSILWPKFGPWKAARIVCMAGMVLAVPFFLLALWSTSLFALIFWALVFADCFRRRQVLAAAGPGVMDEDDSPSYNYMDAPAPRRRKLKKRWFRSARKRASRDQAEQARIDAILVKVKDKGLHSLTWWEKRALRKATERQRQRDLAERY